MSIRDSVCVIGGVLLGGGICYKLFMSEGPQPVPTPPDSPLGPTPPDPQPVLTPPDQCNFHTDIVILHANTDQSEADECKTFLMNNFPDISNLQVVLPEDLLAPGSQRLPGLSSLLDLCRLVFIYLTENIESDTVAGFGRQINLIQSLEDPQKANRIIPLQVNEGNILVELSPLIPLKYVKDKTDRQFPIFKRKLESLVKSWRNTLP
ncbi:unnamed protein product [Mytilus coruscus]|uniref:Uncharacterized protein n=1 Tax=Mytilus coruscus TaxID=42192 RepID=A0A6J8C0Z7_MYTCO|nr:unnamed protein product [Mytilus coruscus]